MIATLYEKTTRRPRVQRRATARRYLGRFAHQAVFDDTPGPWPTDLESGAGAQPLLPVLAAEQNLDPQRDRGSNCCRPRVLTRTGLWGGIGVDYGPCTRGVYVY